jgi:AcrR family transcriptional regulator
MKNGPSTARKTPVPPKTKTRKNIAEPVQDKPYHHGSLPHALLEAAETVLRRDGIGSLTLRAIAREAGVSHTAPQHHFGDTAGVLSELAASGHRRLAATMAAKAEGIPSGPASRKAIARGYVSFAVDNPDLLRLMFRSEMLDNTRASLVDARQRSARALMGAFDEQITPASGKSVTFGRLDAAQAIAMTAGWAYVHGLASLLIDGRLKALAASTEGIRNTEELVDAAIEHMQLIHDAGLKLKAGQATSKRPKPKAETSDSL